MQYIQIYKQYIPIYTQYIYYTNTLYIYIYIYIQREFFFLYTMYSSIVYISEKRKNIAL